MSLVPTGRSALRVRVLPRFPAQIVGRGGIAVELSGGVITVSFRPADLAPRDDALEGVTLLGVGPDGLPVQFPLTWFAQAVARALRDYPNAIDGLNVGDVFWSGGALSKVQP